MMVHAHDELKFGARCIAAALSLPLSAACWLSPSASIGVAMHRHAKVRAYIRYDARTATAWVHACVRTAVTAIQRSRPTGLADRRRCAPVAVSLSATRVLLLLLLLQAPKLAEPVRLDDSFTFPQLDVSSLSCGEFSLPEGWLLAHGTGNRSNAVASPLAGRRSEDDMKNEDVAFKAAAGSACNRCEASDAILRADHRAVRALAAEWRALVAHAAAMQRQATQQQEEEGEGAEASLPRLCHRHRLLLRSALGSGPALSDADPAPLQPLPQPRSLSAASSPAHAEAAAGRSSGGSSSSWAALDRELFQRCYTLPDPSDEPAPAPVDSHGDGPAAPSKPAAAATPAATTPTPAKAISGVCAGATPAPAPASPSRRLHRSHELSSLHIDCVDGAAGKPTTSNLLAAAAAAEGEEGRRSGRVSRLRLEAEQAEAKRAQEALAKRRREQEARQARIDAEQIARIKDGQRAASSAAAAAAAASAASRSRSSSSLATPISLLGFPSLLARAAPDGLLLQAAAHQPVPLALAPRSDARNKLDAMSGVHLAMVSCFSFLFFFPLQLLLRLVSFDCVSNRSCAFQHTNAA